MSVKPPRSYVPLDANYFRDVAVRKAGPNAELLYIRSLAFAKSSRTAGFVSRWDLVEFSSGLRGAEKLARILVEVGLWEDTDDGWFIRSWERWNAADKAVSAGGSLGNHIRWHVKKGRIESGCEHCEASPPDRPPIRGAITPESGPASQQNRTEEKNPPTPREGDEPGPRSEEGSIEPEPDPFDDFWAAYPRKTSKPAARQAWQAALKKTDSITIMRGLERYRFSQDPQYVPHPKTWLNQERWADETSNVLPIRPGVATSADGRRVKWVKPTETSRWREAFPDEVCVGLYKIKYMPPGEVPA